ncbi:SirB1 family protein [Pasteurella multocida]
MNYVKKALYDEMLSFYHTTLGMEHEDRLRLRGQIGHLVRVARKEIPDTLETKAKIHLLLQLFYGEWGFHCDPGSYFLSSNLYLNDVLETRRGMPVSLGAILLYIADKLNLPLYPVNFPTQLVIRAEVEGEVAFINPWDGQYISQALLHKWYEGAMGFGMTLTPAELAIANVGDLLGRFRQLAKNALIREEKNDEAFCYIARLIHYNPEDPYEIRDRGLVLAQMGCYHVATEDFQYFIDQCPQDPTALLLKNQLEELKQDTYPIH